MDHVNHILVVDDDHDIRTDVVDYLRKNGLRASATVDGRGMFVQLDATAFDLIVLDIMMPGDDGLMLCRTLRCGKHRAVPILLLTARDDETDRIVGMEMGADDYVVKPFSSRELLARITAVIRRSRMLPPNLRSTETVNAMSFGSWRLDARARQLIDQEGTIIALSGAEFRLLRVFLDNPQRVLSRNQLLNLTQGRDTEFFDRSIDLLVSRLRTLLDDNAKEQAYIKTVRSKGYVFSMPVTVHA